MKFTYSEPESILFAPSMVIYIYILELSDKCYFQKHEWETSRLKNLKSQGFE